MTMSGALPEYSGDENAGNVAAGGESPVMPTPRGENTGSGIESPLPETVHAAATDPIPDASQDASSSATTADPSSALVWPPEDFFTLDSRHIRADRMAGLIFSAMILLGSVIGIGIMVFASGWDIVTSIVLAGCLLLLAAVTVLGWIWPKWEFALTRWRLNPSGLEIHKGVLWRHRVVVPLSRVQHADVTQGPLQRWYGIGTLVVHTAGTSHASVELQGIDHEGAVQLRDTIVRFRSGHDGN
jgi:uncharacterized protein